MKELNIKKILIPLDFSFTSMKALDQAVVLAKLTDAEITLVHVIENIYATTEPAYYSIPISESYESDLMKLSNESLSKVAEKIKKKGVNKVKIVSITGRTHKEIIGLSKKIKADIIVIGTHGVSGFREFIMGSNTYRIVSDAKCPVLSVQRKNKAESFKTILVPFTDHPHSREKVMYAIRMGEIYDAALHILGIDDERTKAHSKKIELEAKQIKQLVENYNLNCVIKTISASYLAKTLLDYAKKINADAIVTIGDDYRQDITEYFTGSISQQIVNHSPIPVLSIHSRFNPDTVDLRFY
ncbi:MAG: universal stress protein [Bacteroidia bacterium]